MVTLASGSGRADVIMMWLQLVGSLKLQVSFAEYSLFYRALLTISSLVFDHFDDHFEPRFPGNGLCQFRSSNAVTLK